MGTFTRSTVLGLFVAVVVSTPVATQQGATDGQWRYYGGGPGGTAYSPLDQIASAIRALDAHAMQQRLGHFALRESAARKEPPEPP